MLTNQMRTTCIAMERTPSTMLLPTMLFKKKKNHKKLSFGSLQQTEITSMRVSKRNCLVLPLSHMEEKNKSKESIYCTLFLMKCYIYTKQLHTSSIAVASWLVSWTPEWACRSYARDIVLCSWARHITLFPLRCTNGYRWIWFWVVTLRCVSIPFSREVEILLVASCYWNRDKFRPFEPLGSYTD